MKINVSMISSLAPVATGIEAATLHVALPIAIPNFVKARTTSQANACINNLRQMDGAVQQYALENKLASTSSYTLSNLKPYIKLDSTGNIPGCPASGTYSAGSTVTNPPLCSLS